MTRVLEERVLTIHPRIPLLTASTLQYKVTGMTENPAAANPEDAASLLNVVKESQSKTRQVLRHGLPDMTMVILAASMADLARTDSTRSLYFGVGIVIWIGIGAVQHARRLHRFGSSISRTTWTAVAVAFLGTLLINAAFDGSARRAAVAVLMLVVFSALGIAYRKVIFFPIGALVFAVGMGRALDVPTAALIALAVISIGVITAFFRKQVFGDA